MLTVDLIKSWQVSVIKNCNEMECFWLKRKALLMRKNLTRSLICVLTYREIRCISPCQHSMKFRAQIKFLKSLKINTSLKNSIVKKYMSILVYLPLPLHFIPSLFHFCISEVPVPDTGYINRVPQLPQLGKSCRTALSQMWVQSHTCPSA